MEKATITMIRPRTMKDFIVNEIAGGPFSTPGEYIRSLICDDRDRKAGAKP
jgi:hypothetical protein